MCAINFDVFIMFTECPAGLYGHDCQESCSTHCIASGTCDRVTGQCDGGCQAGWKESKCDKSRSIPLFVKCKQIIFLCACVKLILYISECILIFPRLLSCKM